MSHSFVTADVEIDPFTGKFRPILIHEFSVLAAHYGSNDDFLRGSAGGIVSTGIDLSRFASVDVTSAVPR